jgi:hypothetical protein
MSLSIRKLATLATMALAIAACGDDDDNGGNGPSPLTTPTNLVAQATSSTAIQVDFSTVTGATGYIIERAVGTGAFSVLSEPTANTFTDTGLLPSSTYRYRVAAKSTDASLNSPFSSEVSTTTLLPGRTVVEVNTDITTSTTWVADNVYRLRGFRKVANGAVLTIQPGTRIEGDVGTTGSSLFVLRGAQIDANGTADFPIVFTSSQAAGTRQPGDWGGLIIVGNGIINRADPTNLEGTGTDPVTNPLLNYAGGTDNTSSSGTLRYVRVEFAGFGPAQDQELNSFTFAAVGSGTTMEYLQALGGLDDAFEWFGGAVDGKYLVSYEAGDDHFDMSEGYVGRLQYLIAFQSKILQPRPGAGNVSADPQGIENDGCAGTNCANGQDSQPFTIPLVANFTLVGFPTTGVTVPAGGGRGVVLRRGTGGYYVNGIVARNINGGLSLRDNATTGARVTAGFLDVRNHLVAESASLLDASTNVTTFDTTGKGLRHQPATTAASLFTSLPLAPVDGNSLDWTPVAGSAATTGGLSTFTGNIAAKAGTVVTPTTYVGAADPAGAKWWAGWTNYAAN